MPPAGGCGRCPLAVWTHSGLVQHSQQQQQQQQHPGTAWIRARPHCNGAVNDTGGGGGPELTQSVAQLDYMTPVA